MISSDQDPKQDSCSALIPYLLEWPQGHISLVIRFMKTDKELSLLPQFFSHIFPPL